ncbi:precorrin-2 C(20)-methyltransferase [Zhongshania marina]|jgi:precorrin-2/cobalt-factor-2 C20-methyltransferase|uniref:Precorrin-2 C(20)-methyltransferase n=1 Tax=Zhongshania marina TaxID=2304603 RepID=A0ABX9W1C1_9GAMM|nr:precorrin-2 C(20)-methyltransferase [Zhongshania marina]
MGKIHQHGHLYGIGVGPGDPELLTLKAVRLLGECPVVAYFCKRGGLGRARNNCAMHLTNEHIELPLVYPVTTELNHKSEEYRLSIEAFFDSAAEAVASELEAGRDVAMLNEGDAFFYGSFMHVFLRLKSRFEITVVPGVNSIMACGALLPQPLVMRDDVLTVIPGTLDDDALEASMSGSKATVIMKVGSNLERIRGVAQRLGMADRAWYVEKASLPDQKVMPLSDVSLASAPYFSMVLIPGSGERV